MEWYYIAGLALAAQWILAVVIKGIRGPSKNPWVAGNGCNFVKWFGFKSDCCTAHDKAYKQGGWVIARLKADLKLTWCVRHSLFGLILAVPMFVFVFLFGGWAFQYGKKREV